MKKRKLIMLSVLALLLMVTTILFISNTYARYASEISGTGDVVAAKWKVNVGGKAIEGPGPHTFTSSLVFAPVANSNVVDGKIAPATEASTLIEIDPTGAEVAMEYVVELGAITGTPQPDTDRFKVSKVEYLTGTADQTNPSNWTTITISGTEYKGAIELPGTSSKTAMTAAQKTYVRVTIEWANVEAKNENDTLVGAAAPTLTVATTVTVSQKIS